MKESTSATILQKLSQQPKTRYLKTKETIVLKQWQVEFVPPPPHQQQTSSSTKCSHTKKSSTTVTTKHTHQTPKVWSKASPYSTTPKIFINRSRTQVHLKKVGCSNNSILQIIVMIIEGSNQVIFRGVRRLGGLTLMTRSIRRMRLGITCGKGTTVLMEKRMVLVRFLGIGRLKIRINYCTLKLKVTQLHFQNNEVILISINKTTKVVLV